MVYVSDGIKMGWSEFYESSFSQVLHSCLYRLCSEHLPTDEKVEIDGIVCITTGDTDKQIVLKIHDIVDKSRMSPYSHERIPPSVPDTYVPFSHHSKPDPRSLSLVPKQKNKLPKQEIKSHAKPDVKPHAQFSQGFRPKGQLCESDESLIDVYKREGALAANPMYNPALNSAPKQNHTQHVPATPSSSSRRKQAKPQMVTQVPDEDDENENEAMSTGDMENWYAGVDDSDNDGDMMGLAASMPASMNVMPYSTHNRPPRQRVPLASELVTPAPNASYDFVCRKCSRRFQSFQQLQVHNMELHKR